MKKKKAVICYLFIYFLLGNWGCNVIAQTPQVLKVFTQKENLSHAGIGFKAVDLTTGKVIASYNEDMSLTPASTMKIVTTSTALEVLGSSCFYSTHLFYDGILEDSVLKGNLYIEGSGDPSLGSEFSEKGKDVFIDNFLSGIREEGIKSIEGNIVVLDQLFGYDGVSPKYLWEDLGNYYASGIYGISIFDNMYRVYLQSFDPDSETTVLYMEPEIEAIQFTNEITAGSTNSDNSAILGTPFSYNRRLYGTIPPNKTSFAVRGDIPDPGLFLAQYFVSSLQKQGIEVKGEALTYRINPQIPQERKEIAVNNSNNLASLTRVVNVRSNNHYAEHLYKTLQLTKEIDIPVYWKSKGLDSSALFMFDGSGISPANAISAGFLTDILVYMNKKSGKSGAFYKSLPIAGKEGTVASFLKSTPLAGKARVKSGSITNVQSYAGYVEKDDKRYAFAIIVNNFTGKRADVRKEIEQLLVGLF